MSINVNWKDLIYRIAEEDERLFASRGIKITICIQPSIVEEVGRQIERTIERDGIEHGNAAKIAGVTAFWIRKLKPLYIEPSPESPKTYTLINELVSVQVGVAICNEYFSDSSCKNAKVNSRVLKDWLISFRYHSHSPHSSLISFEMLTCEK
jgi:hypothetical protein